jgi:hypothetical protein
MDGSQVIEFAREAIARAGRKCWPKFSFDHRPSHKQELSRKGALGIVVHSPPAEEPQPGLMIATATHLRRRLSSGEEPPACGSRPRR